MPEILSLGVVGTAVIDQIFPFRDRSDKRCRAEKGPRPEQGRRADPAAMSRRGRSGSQPVRSMGGIYYSLHALAALAPHPSFVVPALNVGADAAAFIRSELAGLGFDTRFVRATRARQNRVELRYTSPQRREEILTGGVPPLRDADLAPVLEEIDVLYLNFIAGNELGLPTLRRVRRSFRGPIYADLHSLLLGRARSGLRVRRPLPRWREWVACFDALQCNAEEAAALLASDGRRRSWKPGAEPPPLDGAARERLAREVLRLRPRLFVLTDGPEPVRAWVRGGRPWRLPPVRVGPARDPTGCGDVLGAAFCALHFQRRMPERRALERAVEIAGWKVTRSGSDDLASELRAWYHERHG